MQINGCSITEMSHDIECLGHDLNLGLCTYEAAVVLVLSHIVFLDHMVGRHPRCVFINYNWINQLSNTTIWWLYMSFIT